MRSSFECDAKEEKNAERERASYNWNGSLKVIGTKVHSHRSYEATREKKRKNTPIRNAKRSNALSQVHLHTSLVSISVHGIIEFLTRTRSHRIDYTANTQRFRSVIHFNLQIK